MKKDWIKLAILAVLVLIFLGVVFSPAKPAQEKETTLQKISRQGKMDVCYVVWEPTISRIRTQENFPENSLMQLNTLQA